MVQRASRRVAPDSAPTTGGGPNFDGAMGRCSACAASHLLVPVLISSTTKPLRVRAPTLSIISFRLSWNKLLAHKNLIGFSIFFLHLIPAAEIELHRWYIGPFDFEVESIEPPVLMHYGLAAAHEVPSDATTPRGAAHSEVAQVRARRIVALRHFRRPRVHIDEPDQSPRRRRCHRRCFRSS